MNRNLVPIKTSIFRNKLSKILERLHKERDKLPAQTREAIIGEAVRLLSLFYRTIGEPGFNPKKAIAGTRPDADDYNENLNVLKDDLDILFTELENLEAVVLEQFNLITTQTNRINSRIKRLSSSIVDFSLFSKLPIKNALFFTDSFTDTSKVEINSALLNAGQCEVEQAEGIVKLPIDAGGTKTVTITAKPSINSNSNGRTGNNEEVGVVQLRNNIEVITDNNPDTWFEYERVVQQDDGIPLVLDVTLNLTEEQIINFIRVNPNNFGTKTEIEIQDIATSTDGTVYKSIKDEFPITGLLIEDIENVFKLAPATSKFAGQGLFSFTPRYAKYVKLTLRQISPYLIDTVRGQQFRYAIGLRDIEVQSQAFQATGELVSAVFDVGSEVKKVALRTNQSPLQASELGSIRHQISVDDGNTWIDIDPIEDNGVLNVADSVPEVVNINTEDVGSVNTATPITSLRYKAILSRDDAGFNDSSTTFAEEVTETTELKSIPLAEPWAITLDKNPIVDSVAVLDTSFGSRGNDQFKYVIGNSNGSQQQFRLPWDDLRLDKTKVEINGQWRVTDLDIFTVFVGGEEWTQIHSLSAAGPNDKVYVIRSVNSGSFSSSGNFVRGHNTSAVELVFGDGINGLSPPTGVPIEILFTDERLYPVSKQQHTASIMFPTSADKSTVSIYRRGSVLPNTVTLKGDTNIQRLPHRNIIIDAAHPITFTNTDGTFTDRKTYQNGLESPAGELVNTGDYSVDTDRGLIYSFDRTDATPGTVTYYYQDQVQLDAAQWDWGDTLPVHKSVVIKEDGWVPNKVVGETTIEGSFKINLRNLAVIEGSVQFGGIDALEDEVNPFLHEVPYIDGVSELATVSQTSEKVAALEPVSNVATFTTTIGIVADTKFAVSFSNTSVFVTAQSNLLDVASTGDYFVDRSTGTVYVHTNGVTITDAGDISYYISDPAKVPTGAYSIDYKDGEIFLQREVPEGVTVSYQYADYFIKYNIAREVAESHWTLDPSTRTITINSSETNLRARISNLSGTNIVRPATYQVNYKYIGSIRKGVADLAPHFTPILRDYVLQVVTADLL